MKLGILTYHFVANYGAVYQAYALKTYLEKFGYDVEVIDYRPVSMRNSWNITACKESYKQSNVFCKHESVLKKLLRNLYVFVMYHVFLMFKYPLLKKKYAQFNTFVYKYLCNKNGIIETKDDFERFNDYDVILYGSDQIWNPDITHGFDPFYFAYYTKRQYKVAYSASIGNLSILLKNSILSKEFMKHLENFDLISVREKNLAEYIKKNGKDAKYIVDPTFLLTLEDYKSISNFIPESKNDYILVYHLRYDKRIDQIAEKIAALNNWKVIIVNGTVSGGMRVIKDMGPCEFMGLLRNAKCIITNSFHGAALSINFNKCFYVVLPEIRQDRLLNLLSDYGLQDRIIRLDENVIPDISIDYKRVNAILSEQRTSAYTFISSILSSSC